MFLIPATGSAPARALRSLQGKIVPAPDIRLETAAIDGGYEVQALIPLTLLALDARRPQMLLEFQVTTQPPGAKRQTGTAFGSPRAYQDSSLYGVFTVPPETGR